MNSRFIVFSVLLLLATPAWGYKLSDNYWTTGKARFYIGIPGISPGGISWSQSLQYSLDQWSNQTAFEFEAVNQYQDPCVNRGPGKFGDGTTSADFGTTACGQEFGSNVLALTLTAGVCFKNDCSSGFDIKDADIIFNSKEQWDVYTGSRRPGRSDFGRVALHELGHAIGLRHEDVNSAIMQATISNIFTLQADDINGANAIYATATARDDQSSNLLSSIYGINVILPAGSELTGTSQNISLTGALESSDSLLDGRHIDIFQYTISQNTQIDIRMESSQINSLLYLARMDSTQRPIDAETYVDDNSGNNLNAWLIKNLNAGTYWIGASSASPGQRGDYTLSFNTGIGTPPTFASYISKYGIPVQINPNSFISGNLGGSDNRLDTGNFIDLYEFTVSVPVTLQIDLSSSAMDTMLYLARVLQNQDLDNSMFYQNNNGGVGTNSRIVETLQPGTYWIGATSFAADATGNYQINISVIP